MSETSQDRPKFNPELLPRWRSHKIVRAAKILQVLPDGTMELAAGATESMSMFAVPAEKMFARYRPVPGDYYVVYDDGFASISPRAAFEEGYHRL